MKVLEKSGNAAEVVASVLSYSICSMSMIILNKLVMFTYGLNFPMGLLLIQNSGAVLLVSFGKYMRWLHYPDFSLEITKKWIPLTFLFVAMLWTSMKSLHTMSVSMQTIIKNLAVIFTAFGDSRFFKKRVTPIMYFSFCLMILGSYMGAKGDQWVTAWGVFWTFANIAATVSYTLYMKLLLGDVSAQIGRYGPVFYNNLLSLPFILAASLKSFPDMLSGFSEATFGALFAVVAMVFAGSVMTFTVFWCMKETSPTTFSVVGAVNKAPLAIMGMIVFKQFPTATGYLGIFLALDGGLIYAFTNVSHDAKAQEHRSDLGLSPNANRELDDGAASATEKLKNVV
ncbi:GDP-mannose transporter [Trypanosoma conorhini]|uniref:GDP-mannose transporter n=1 Tax=Trypanosoma conorhini TaxID=83891 RepID=A0A3R7L0L9_9TRYP|nr:GDP-mannose transporter [Trypanosoma conorhini]RNF18746.1 GDP-mannose transporter [Trypanosoma conorhini]